MMASRRKIVRLAVLIMAAFCLWLGFYPASKAPWNAYAQDTEIHIENRSAYRSRTRAAVHFTHDDHMEQYECLECHHDYSNGNNVLDEDELEKDGRARCAACHPQKASLALKTAYHRQCMGCHRRVNKQEAKGLPITCRDCHPRH